MSIFDEDLVSDPLNTGFSIRPGSLIVLRFATEQVNLIFALVTNKSLWKPFSSGSLTKSSLMLLYHKVWVSIFGKDGIIRIKREKSYKKSTI